MSSQTFRAQTPSANDEAAIRDLYQKLLDGWNRRNASDYAALFAEDGYAVGFDGSQHNGRVEIEAEIGKIFADHQTGRFVGKIREARLLTPEVAVLRAVASVVPAGQADINPATNMIQTLVAARREGQWRIAVFHNTPAQFHGRPELAQKLTAELRQLL
jgi:uncharacterized protein (TIGR02246 family)